MRKTEENYICQKCGNCCRSYWIFTNIPEEVERFETLRSDGKIEVIKINEKLWKIMFHFHCKYLASDSKLNGRWYCSIYKQKRPKYCLEYPRNFLYKEQDKNVLANEVKFCPLLAKLSHN